MQTLIKTNLRQIPIIPKAGEVYISVNLGQVPNVRRTWDIADSLGFKPELVSMEYPNSIEVHLLLHYEQRNPGSLLDDDFDAQIDGLSDAGIPDEAVRFVYGGKWAVAQ